MILPHPESDLNLNIMVLGAEIIEKLSTKKNKDHFILIDKLLEDFLKKDKKRTPELFFHCITFLYSIEIIIYKGYKLKINY